MMAGLMEPGNLQNILWPTHIYFAIHLCAAILVWERQRCAQMFLGSDKSVAGIEEQLKSRGKDRKAVLNVATSEI